MLLLKKNSIQKVQSGVFFFKNKPIDEMCMIKIEILKWSIQAEKLQVTSYKNIYLLEIENMVQGDTFLNLQVIQVDLQGLLFIYFY